jgi:putative ABC transport system permease protein
MISDYLTLAFRNLKKRKLRSWLTMLGIFISIAAIFVLIAVSLGFQVAVEEQFRLLGTDKIFVMPQGQLAGPGTSGAVSLKEKDAEVVERVPGVREISYFYIANAEVEYNKEKRFFMVVGMPEGKTKVMEETNAYKPDEGSLLRASDTGKIMIGSQYKYNKVFNNPLKAGDKLTINGVEFKVSCILQPIGNPQDDKLIYMYFDEFKQISNSTDVQQMIVQINPGEDIQEVAKRIEKKLIDTRGLTEKTKDFTLLTPEELLSSFGSILSIVTGFLLGVAAISLLVGAIGITNTMYTSVLERTKEIGVMKAVGAKNSDILTIFLIESGLLGLTGGLIGVLLGMGIGKSIEYIAINFIGTNLLRVVFPSYLIIGCLVFAFLVGAISGTWPAYRASKIRPVDALRYE